MFLGTAALGSVDPTGIFDRRAAREAFRILDDAYDVGCRGLDLARSYQAGGTERVVGHWLRANGVRDALCLVSKAGHPIPLVAPSRLFSSALEADLTSTLRALGIDALDGLLLHRDDGRPDLSGVARDLARFREQGWVRWTGVSNWTFDRWSALEAASSSSVVHASSPQFSLAAWRAPLWRGCVSISGREHAYERNCYRRAGITTFAYSPLGRGSLARTSRRGAGTFGGRENERRRERCRTLAARHGATAAQIAIAYLLQQPFPVYPVVGVSTRAHMVANLEAADLTLSSEELHWLETGRSHEDEVAIS